MRVSREPGMEGAAGSGSEREADDRLGEAGVVLVAGDVPAAADHEMELT